MIERNNKFTEHGFPVDVLWLDIDHTYNNRYFHFNPFTYPLNMVEKLNTAVREAGRHMVLIADPHIKAD